MPRHKHDTANWNKTNLMPDKSGELRSRGICSPAGLIGPSGFSLDPAGFNSVYTSRAQSDDVSRLYAVVNTSNGVQIAGLSTAGRYVAERIVGDNIYPEVVTWALVDNILFCASPSFATHYMYLPGQAYEAVSEDILNPSGDVLLKSLPFPRGICVEFGGRLVIAADDVLYFSDPGRPFTFLSTNIVDPPGGSVRGLHVSNGALVVCTTTGAYLLPQEAAQRADVFGSFQKVSNYSCLEYAQTTEHNGVVWGVSKEGITSVYPAGANIDVNQDKGVFNYHEPFNSPNWRNEGRMLELGDLGVGLVATNQKGTFLLNPDAGFGSWLCSADNPDLFNLRGYTHLRSGEQVLVGLEGSHILRGNSERTFFGDSTEAAPVYASLSGSVREHSVDRSPVMRKVQVAAGLGGDGEVYFAHQGGAVKTDTPPARGVIAGTTEWDDGTRLQELEVRSREFNAAYRSDDHEIEVGVNEPDRVVRTDITIEFHGIGKYRSTN